MNKYVWVDIKTGAWSSTWTLESTAIKWETEEDMLKDIGGTEGSSYKLIKYECLNDESFEFSKLMKLN